MFGTTDGLMEEILHQASERVVQLASPFFAKGMAPADVARSMNMTQDVVAKAFERTGVTMPGAPVKRAAEPQAQGGPSEAERRAAEAAERADIRENLELLRNAISRLKPASTPTSRGPEPDRDPGVDRSQTKADLLAKLKPLLAADEEERLRARLAKKALRRLSRGR